MKNLFHGLPWLSAELCGMICGAGAVLLLPAWAGAQEETVDWLLKTQATTAPTTRPAGATTRSIASPLVRASSERDAIAGTITLSNGKQVTGKISTTPGKPLRVWMEEEHQYHDIPLSDIASMTVNVLWERQEKEWHFIASGSDVKEYTGRSYPARELAYTLVLRDGKKVTGGVVAPIYLETAEGEQREFILHKRDKGEMGKTLEELVYLKKVEMEK